MVRLLRAYRTGNPYHDPATGQFTSGGGGSKSARKRRRRKKRLAALKKDLHAQAAELKESHAWERKEWLKEERRDRRDLKKRFRKEWASTIRQARREIGKAKTAKERNEIRARAKEDLHNLRADYPAQLAELKQSHAEQRESIKSTHREEWAGFKDDMREAISDAGFKLRKTNGGTGRSADDMAGPAGILQITRPGAAEQRADADGIVGDHVFPEVHLYGRGEWIHRGGRFSPGRTHKASNAESILRHCLRSLGLTRRYRQGGMTARQARRLLDAIRRYGRAWLRHEAEGVVKGIGDALVREPNRTADDSEVGNGGQSAGLHRMLRDGAGSAHGEVVSGVLRWIKWIEQPGGFLHAEEHGIKASLGRFFARAKQFVRETIVAGAMALLGPAPLTAEELDQAEREAQRQEQFFDRFKSEATGPAARDMTPKQFIARAEQYADSVHHAAQNINRAAAIHQGIARQERLVMGHPKTEHCSECPEDAARGWVPVGTLRPIGARECGHLCLCHFEYQDGNGKTFYQGKRGPLPSPPRPADLEPDDGGVYPVAEPPGGLKELIPIAGPPTK